MKALRARITYANVMSSLALFVALGGVSYATLRLSPRSVGEAQLRDEAVSRRALSRSVRALLSRPAVGERGPVGPPGPAGSPGSLNGIPLGGDLEGSFPNATLRPGSVSSSVIADGTVTGADVNESSLAAVPLATRASQLSDIPTADLVRGGGKIWRSDADDFAWRPAEDGVILGWAVAFLTRDPDPLFVGAQCYHSSDSGGGVRAALSNYGPTPVQVVIDDGADPPQAISLDASDATFTPIVTDTTRRIVFQGVRGTDQYFFASIFIEHQGDACRATATGYLIP